MLARPREISIQELVAGAKYNHFTAIPHGSLLTLIGDHLRRDRWGLGFAFKGSGLTVTLAPKPITTIAAD